MNHISNSYIYDPAQAIKASQEQWMHPPRQFVVEAVPGGFIVIGDGYRQVARNVHAVARLLRDWAPKPEAKTES